MKTQNARAEDQLAQIRSHIVEVIRKEGGVTEEVATRTAAGCIATLRRVFGGEELYIRQREYNPDQVLADFNGRNQADVCRKHEISRRTLYRILRRRTLGR